MKLIRILPVLLLLLAVSGFKECYQPVTKSGLPEYIETIAVPAFQFEAKGARYRVASRFTDAVIREVIKRGRGLKVQGTREGADAAIEGNIRDFSFSGVLLDREGRARVYEVTITSAVTVIDLKNNSILYDNQNFVFRDSFEFSDDPRSFFNEEDPAVERMARAFAESVVSTITNGIGVRKRRELKHGSQEMNILTRSDLRNLLRNRELAPVYLLFGVETYLRDIAARTIAEFSIGQPELREFNEHEVSLNDSTISDALAAAEQLPFGADKRVVILKEFSLSTNRQNSSLRDNDEERIAAYLEDPSPTSVLIFVANEFDKRLKTSKLFTEKAVTVEFAGLAEGEAAKWVRDKMKEAGVEADQMTITRLIGLAGTDARKLSVEVEKLATAALPEKVITLELVETLVKHSRVLSNFDLTDHLVAGRRQAAIHVMGKILDDGAEPLMLLGLLSYNFRQLCTAKDLMNQGLDRQEVMRSMRLRGNQARFFEAARKTGPGVFENSLIRIAKADLAIKTVGTPRLQIEMLVCELALG